MSRTWIICLLVLCLTWTPQVFGGLCSNVSKLECRGFDCPGGRGGGGGCDYDSILRKFVCTTSCSNDPNKDPCTCLANYRGCHIRVNATDAASQVTFQGRPQTTYSCVNSSAVKNCNYDVHVLSSFRGNGDIISWNDVLGTSRTTVNINGGGVGGTSRAVVLVLLSHYPTYWMLNVPSGVTIAKVLLSSYHVDVSEVSYPNGTVLSVEKVSNRLLPSLAYGFDEIGDHVMEALQYLTRRFGSISSFTGAYEADRFTLSLHGGGSQDQSGCVPFVPPVAASSPVISAQCHPTTNSCFGITTFRATCSDDGYCRCPNLANKDPCTCLVNVGSCSVEKSARGNNSAGRPLYQRRPQITSSCVANDNCQNSVHVISTYEATNTGFSVRAARSTVRVSVSGDEEDPRPLILILTSYYPIRWSLSIPQGVVFDKLIVSSFYLSQTSVSYPQGSVLAVERLTCSGTVQCYADGYDDATVEQLQYVSDRYGPVSSWSSAQRANVWDLNIERKNGCDRTNSLTTSNSASLCPVIPVRNTAAPTFPTRPDSGSNGRPRPPVAPTPTTSSPSSLTVGIAAGVPILSVGAGILLALLVWGVSRCEKKPNGSRTHRHGRPSLHPQQNIYTAQSRGQLQPATSATVHHSAQPQRVGVQTGGVYSMIAVTPPTVPASWGHSGMVVPSKPHTGDLTDSAPPDYNEALSYPVPTSTSLMHPPPYSQ